MNLAAKSSCWKGSGSKPCIFKGQNLQLKVPSGIIGKQPFRAKSWPGAFWSQILGLWWLGALQLKLPSGLPGKRRFWATSWPGAFWSQILGIWWWSPAIKNAFWNHWETAVLGQILARSLLEAKFCDLRAFGPAIKSAFWDP